MHMHQHASGKFSCDVVPGTPHCGKDENRGHFRYCVDVVYSSHEALDDRGFLLDNLDFKHYFDGVTRVSVSCEQLAMDACRYFTRKLEGRLKHVVSIDVKIYPFGDVYVESEEVFVSVGVKP